MPSIMREFGIDAGHRLHNHEGKCKHLHGHRYTFQVWFISDHLDQVGRVVDFGTIKNKIGGWLENHWDHGLILSEVDPMTKFFADSQSAMYFVDPGDDVDPFYHQKLFILPFNPTAENLCRYLFQIIVDLTKDMELKVSKVGCWETPNCYAEYP